MSASQSASSLLASLNNSAQNPPPYPHRSMHVGDVDSRSQSFLADLQAAQDTITGTPTVMISRVDGNPMGSNDLQLQPNSVSVDATGTIVTFWLQNALNPNIVYWIDVTITTKQNRTITRTGYLAVVPQIG